MAKSAPRKRNIVLSIVTRTLTCVLLLVIALVVFVALVQTRPQPAKEVGREDPTRVQVMVAEMVPVRRAWEGYGTAEAMVTVDVPARVTATVESLGQGIDPGERIEQGDLLAVLDASDFERQQRIAAEAIEDLQAQLDRLEVEQTAIEDRLELAREEVDIRKQELQRVQDALVRNAAKEREVDAARSALLSGQRAAVMAQEELDQLPTRRRSLQALIASQQAQKELAELSVDRSRITAPIGGVLQTVDVEVGENLRSGERVARIVQLDAIEVPLRLPASARASIGVGDSAELYSTGASGMSWSANVARIAPEDDPSTRTFTVYVVVEQSPQGNALLTPGRYVRGVVRSDDAQPRWVVPRRALENDRILTVREGRIRSERVDIDFYVQQTFPRFGIDDADWAVLASTLADGELVVLNVSRTLPDGLRVEPVRPNTDATAMDNGEPVG